MQVWRGLLRALSLAVMAAVLLTGCVVVSETPGGGPTVRGGRGSPGDAGGGSEDGYNFIHTRNGEPVRWSTCEPVRYVVREKYEPEGGRRLLRQSIGRISEASGLKFSFQGTTDEGPNPRRPVYQPDRYGDRWAPVLIAYSNPEEDKRLRGRAAGYGAPVFLQPSGAVPRYVSGSVVFDVEQITSMGDEDAMRAVMLHELAHVAGLGHVNDRGQLMNPVQYGWGVTDLQQGDLAGLEILGSGKCYKPAEPRRVGNSRPEP